MRLAREGWGIVGGAVAVAAVATLAAGVAAALPLWLVALFALQFFRDPAREVNARAAAAGMVLSAADGRVVHVGRGASPVDGGERLKISVFMNVFNVHANRAPVAGRVALSRRFAGVFFNAALDKASEENERHLIVIDAAGGTVECMQIAGLLARRVLCYAGEGDALTAGQRYGFIRFGSRVDLYLPLECEARARLGERVTAGVTVLAAFAGAGVTAAAGADADGGAA